MMPAVAVDPLLLLVAGLAVDGVVGDMPQSFAMSRIPSSSPAAPSPSSTASSTARAVARPRAASRGVVTVIVLVGGAALAG